MSNVISLGAPKRPNLSQRQALLLNSFATQRRATDDVFWLKENAELLNILANSGALLPPHALDVYSGFYESLEERMRFFPQYYRFLLSICLDLEDLGLGGDTGRKLCEAVQLGDLAACELSDLQRAEAQYLLARRGVGTLCPAVRGRLLDFTAEPHIFSVPNKKAAYELTHIVFYLTSYGRMQAELPQTTVISLEYAGLMAFLDQDVDLLAEVCVALRFAGQSPSEIWEDWLAREIGSFTLVPAQNGPVSDAYHEYLVTSWWAGVAGMAGFTGRPPAGNIEILRSPAGPGPLRAISSLLYQLGPARSGDWSHMRAIFARSLEHDQNAILEGAAQSCPHFDRFFERFSRSN
ncbi:hypothetical protein CEP88_05515 [Roseobacter denitrificans]|uniref:Uncharacterized protein n=1 Tax=Roseobacter denitrificans (strain ATCC 33942 / OCh 114) TaxID=375451 RepID=Q164B7_ROSDO|nr:hypothetical protein [Roseobacter denitrificans]ABG32676.1 hypothetical protein RD1_3169 [Roseobacter denitrificans OCh 114]AVL52106.1 hypothetical protein CEP88_05515 [Roseobacter denitrificans]SFF93580.1 hypothetical protein SAMN05443635_10495 [Roseobacter denitrificans OCh 114]